MASQERLFTRSNLRFFLGLLGPMKRSAVFSFFLASFLHLIGALMEGNSYALMILALSSLLGSKPLPFLAFLEQLPGNAFTQLIVLAVVAQLFRSLFCFIAHMINTRLYARAHATIQTSLHEKLLQLDYSTVHSFQTGRLVEYAKSPGHFLRSLFEEINLLVVTACFIVVSCSLLFYLSWTLTLVAFSIFALASWLQRKIVWRIQNASAGVAADIETLNGEMTQFLNGFRVIHLFGRQKEVKARLGKPLEQVICQSKKISLRIHSVTVINECVGTLLIGLCLILGVAIGGWEEGSLIPSLLGFVTITYRLNNKVSLFMTRLSYLSSLAGPFDQMRQLMELPIRPQESSTAPIPFKKKIEVENLTYEYPSRSKAALETLTFSIDRGEMVAFVGESGSGKSTLIDLLTALYPPTNGQIRVDGRPLTPLEGPVWRRRVGVVSQDPFLFHGSILDNIRFGNQDASDKQVEEAIQAAHIQKLIDRLPEGIHTLVGERGVQLSGGERQRITLARALVRNPEILILDEATSQLDSDTERLIQEALEPLRGKKTLLIVAHRLSTVADADRIFVMENGHLREEGDHGDLLQRGGIYSRLHKLQQALHEPAKQSAQEGNEDSLKAVPSV